MKLLETIDGYKLDIKQFKKYNMPQVTCLDIHSLSWIIYENHQG